MQCKNWMLEKPPVLQQLVVGNLPAVQELLTLQELGAGKATYMCCRRLVLR